MLMSLEDIGGATLPSRFSSLFGNNEQVPPAVEDNMLWPSLNLEQPPTPTYPDHSATMLPPPHGVGSVHSSNGAAQARGYAERVIRAPQNSSWADVLRIEAAEKQMAEAQMALRALGVHRSTSPMDHEPGSTHQVADAKALAAPRAKTAYQMQETVFEPSWKSEEYDDFESAADAERYIFCSRAYMFDAIPRPAAVSTNAGANDLDLPASMPERFRYSADRANRQELPQLTDGDNTSASAGAKNPSLRLPVVNLLLPSAALRGVSGVNAADQEADGDEPHATGSGRNELMQVQCQVLNASRWS